MLFSGLCTSCIIDLMLVQAFTARGHKGGISYILQELQKLKFRVKMQISQGHPGCK
jgi:hypothetical protein